MKVIITNQSDADGHWKPGDLFSYGNDGLFMVEHVTAYEVSAIVIVPRNCPGHSPAGNTSTFSDVKQLRKVTQLNITTV